MKKLLTLLMSAVLVVGSCFALTACSTPTTPTPPSNPQTEIKYSASTSQYDAMTALTTEIADATIVDEGFLHYFNKRSPVQLTAVEQSTVSFSKQSYSFAVQKDSNVALYLNAGLYKLQEDGTLEDIAKLFNVDCSLIEIPEPEVTFDNLPAPEKDSVWANVVKNGYLMVGFAYDEGQKSPYLHMSQYGSADGFEVKILTQICKLFGLDVLSQHNSAEEELFFRDWATVVCTTKEQALMKLESGEVEVVINRINAEDLATANIDFTTSFCADTQVLVVYDDSLTLDDLKTKKFTAGAGTIGEGLIKNQLNAYYFAK